MQEVTTGAICSRELLIERAVEYIQGCRYSFLQRSRRSHCQEVVDLPDGVGQDGGRQNPPDTPAGHTERLGGSADRDGALPHPRQCRQRYVLTLEAYVLVDLIRNRQCVMAYAQIADRLQLGAI